MTNCCHTDISIGPTIRVSAVTSKRAGLYTLVTVLVVRYEPERTDKEREGDLSEVTPTIAAVRRVAESSHNSPSNRPWRFRFGFK